VGDGPSGGKKPLLKGERKRGFIDKPVTDAFCHLLFAKRGKESFSQEKKRFSARGGGYYVRREMGGFRGMEWGVWGWGYMEGQ